MISIQPATTDLAAALRIRRLVFQQEQGVDPALDEDGQDEQAIQFLAYWQEHPVGTARIRVLTDAAKIERMAVLAEWRGQGIGKHLMVSMLEFAASHRIRRVKLNAQVHAQAFYQALGFQSQGELFQEAGIDHVTMIKDLT